MINGRWYIMKKSFITEKENGRDYKFAQLIGLDIFKLKDPEKVDVLIKKLKNENYNTIFIPDELASFSEDITKKYSNDPNLKIIIMPNRK